MFDTKCGVTFLFDHLDSVSEEIQKHAPSKPATSTATDNSLAIPVKAGTLLGYTDGTPFARTFDFLVLDNNQSAFYINPKRWKWEQSLYAVCPYDFYNSELREKCYQKLGEAYSDGFKKSENCGNPSYDIAGTLSGGWFLNEQATELDGEFMLIGERMGAVDITLKTESENTKLRITDYSSTKLPKDIGVGEAHCYAGFNNDWIYLHLIEDSTIEMVTCSGNCPAAFPSTSAKKYYR